MKRDNFNLLKIQPLCRYIVFMLFVCECDVLFCCRTKYCTKSLSAVEAIKLKANAAFEQEKYNQAIKLYNQALSMCADEPLLYGNRAAAYLKRNWSVVTYVFVYVEFSEWLMPLCSFWSVKFVNCYELGPSFSKLLRKIFGRFLILGESIGKYLAKH